MNYTNNSDINLFLSLLNSAIINEPITLSNLCLDNLDKVLKLAEYHSVDNMMYYALKINGIKIPEGLEKMHKVYFYKSITQDAELDIIKEYFNKEHIYYLPLKGSYLKHYYPNPDMRVMADLDILTDEASLKKCGKILNSLGYTTEETGGNHDVYMKLPYMNIEMHRRLFSFDSLYYDYFKDILNKVNKDNYLMKFSNEDYYLHMLAHSAKHFAGGGTGIRIFADVYLFKKYHSLDETILNEGLIKLNLVKYDNIINRLTNKIFITKDAFDDDELTIFNFIISSGTYGTVANYINNISVSEGERKSKFSYIFKRIFPPLVTMKALYKFLIKAPYLLPVAWVMRIFKGILHFNQHKNEFNTFNELTNEEINKVSKIKKISGIE